MNEEQNVIDIDDLELGSELETSTTKVTPTGEFIEVTEASKKAQFPDDESIDDYLQKPKAKLTAKNKEQKTIKDFDGNEFQAEDLDDYDLENKSNIVDEETKSYQDYIKQAYGEVITLEDGTEISVDSLSKEDMQNIISSMESDSENESNQTIDETAEMLLQAYSQDGIEGVIELLKANNLLDSNTTKAQSDIIQQIKSMSDEELLYIDAQNKCSDCTAEELEATVDSMKQSKGYKKLVQGIKQSLIQEEQYRLQVEEKQAELEHSKQLEEIRQEVYNQVNNILEIFGIENNKEIINEIAPMLLTPSSEDPEYSEFINYLLSDPTAQYKAAFYLTYENQIKQFVNDQIKEAEAKGKNSVFSKLSTKPKSSINTDKRITKPSTGNNKINNNEVISIDDL